jgi:uncharacterized phage-like protein YoqJ
MQGKTCSIIGYLAIPADKADAVQRELEREVKAALDDGYRTFITEFTEGVGLLFARHIGELRKDYQGVFWETIMPPKENSWPFGQEEWALLRTSDSVRWLCEDCRNEYPLSVTRYMVEQSSRVITVYAENGDHDTCYAIDYAGTMERDLRNIQLY